MTVLHDFLVRSQNRLNGASLISARFLQDGVARFLSMLLEWIKWGIPN
jgi:hypothetical protein